MSTEVTIGATILAKNYVIATGVAIAGGIAHAIEQVRHAGWKGWVNFLGDIFVCVFFGHVFFQIALHLNPDYAVIFTSLGSFWGVKSFDYLKVWFIKSLEAIIKK